MSSPIAATPGYGLRVSQIAPPKRMLLERLLMMDLPEAIAWNVGIRVNPGLGREDQRCRLTLGKMVIFEMGALE